MKIKDIISKLKNEYGIEYYDAKKLLKFCLNVDENYLIIHNDDELDEIIETKNVDKVFEIADQIKNGKPIQYITKEQDFYGYEFYVDERVLIPQPDTEIVVDSAIKLLTEKIEKKEKLNYIKNKIENHNSNENLNNKVEVLDLCAGSGAIGISIKKHFEDKVNVTLADISKDALDVAKINSDKLNVNCNLVQSNMFENINKKFDLIVSNPPYIKTDVIECLEDNVKNEPKLALDGGKDGLDFYKIISKNYKKYLKENGNLVLEIGYDQKDDVMKFFKNSECIKDFAGNNRVIIAE